MVGEDFRFGYNREGNVNLLKKYQEKGAFNVEAIKKNQIITIIYSHHH